MNIRNRVERLEQRAGSQGLSTADRLATALRGGREAPAATTTEDREEALRREHEAALSAMPPGQRAPPLARRLYAANLRLARHYFQRNADSEHLNLRGT
jgi:hypothetical protein